MLEKWSNYFICHLRFPLRPQISFRNFIFCKKKAILKHLSVLVQAKFLSCILFVMVERMG